MAFTKKELERMIQDLQDQADSLVGQGEYKLADQRLKRIKELKEQLKHTKDSVEILKLSGFTVDAEEQWITVNGAHVKVESGESKGSAAKKFIKKKGGNPEPTKGATKQSSEIKYDEEEIKKIKSKWKGKESVGGQGSEYGDILNYLEKQATQSGILPDMNEYYKLSDKLIDLREAGKKGTEEYKSVEKQRNNFNKTYNKVYKSLKEKAQSLSSESEQKRLEELNKMVKGNKMNDACGEKVYTKGTEDAERSVTWVKPSEINYKIGDIIQFRGKNVKVIKITGNVVEAQVMDACSNKDSDPKVAEAEAIINLCGGVR